MGHMDSLSQQWLDHSEAERIAAANTIASHARTLRSVGNAGTATREEIEAWWVTRRDLSPGTRANDLSNLREFYRWCAIWEHRDDNPTVRLKAPKVPDGLPRAISRADFHTLLSVLEPDLRRAVALGGWAGLRVSEAAALQWDQIDIEAKRARIENSKGGKSRLVALSSVLIDSLLPDTGGNVVTGTHETQSAAALQRRVNRAIKLAGVNVTFHQLRHRYGTLAYQDTGDLLAVGRQMGHSSPVTTQIYAAASDSMADRIAAAVAR